MACEYKFTFSGFLTYGSHLKNKLSALSAALASLDSRVALTVMLPPLVGWAGIEPAFSFVS